MSEKEKYHFIIGLPRAGTALLSTELNKLEETIVLPESKHVIKMIRNKNNYSNILARYYSSVIPKLKEKPYSVSENIHQVIENASSKGILENAIAIGKCFSFFDDAKNYKFIIDKNPMYTFHWKKIIKEFPESKFIIMIRNPKAFIFSKMEKRHPNEKIHNPYYFAHIWNNFTDQILLFQKQFPTKVKVIKYEDFVSSQKSLSTIISFLDIPTKYDSQNEFQDKYKSIVSNSNLNSRHRTKYSDLSNPINDKRIDAYKQKQSLKLQKRIEAICNKNMILLNYRIEHEKSNNFVLNFPFKVLGKLHNKQALK